jgi:hypothetical protein
MKESRKPITLYDGGGVFLIWMVLGIPFGSVLDYFLNYVVLSQTLKRFLKINTFDEKDFIKDKRKTYGVFATILGLVIDWVYIELVWDVDIVGIVDYHSAHCHALRC